MGFNSGFKGLRQNYSPNTNHLRQSPSQAVLWVTILESKSQMGFLKRECD